MKPDELQNLRHSLAHLLAAAVLELWPNTKQAIGPAIENGFYYDFDFTAPISEAELLKIEEKMREILKTWDKFEKIDVSANEAGKQFKDNSYKLELIDELEQKGEKITLYKSGSYIDLCRGGHVKSAKEINPEAFKLTTIAGAYWRGSEKNKMLTRIYGLAFQTKKELEDHLKLQEEIKRRDHRKLGEHLGLFHFEDIAPGSAFWHGKGMIVWRELEKFMREKLDRENYQEVSTPVMVKKEVFEKSGHWDYYRDNMFYFPNPREPKEIHVLKPMNCPESTYIYNFKIRSYRDLPLRLSEITDRLHRNELSGTLGGLFRVRQMAQDDAHIYCRPDQIEEETKKLIELAKEVYKVFNLPLNFKLATKPDEAMGDSELWDKAEKSLEKVLKNSKIKYEVKPKDGAFYGPKIDIHINDSLGRDWQLATIQLDFQLPGRFDLSYIDEKGKKQKPVMIHRAILGTFERFIGILIEHFGGALPLWLAPVQAVLIPVSEKQDKFAEKVFKELKKNGIRAEIYESGETLPKRIREAELQKIPYILVVGEKEEKNKSVNVRYKNNENEINIAKLIDKMKKEITEKTI